jgi:hypothetical protein
MKIGWIDERRGTALSAQKASLIAFGVNERKIYNGRQYSRVDMLRELRADDELVVYRLSCLAKGREDWRLFIAEAGDRNFKITEAHTGRAELLRRPLAEMWADCLDDWAQRKNSPAGARRAGRKGAKKRWADIERMPIEEARAIWLDVKKYRRTEDALADMWGWSRSSAFRTFRERGTSVELRIKK